MRIAYLDCFSGISGDMFLGALVDAGVPVRVLKEAVAALRIGASLRVSKVDRSGITATKVDVLVDGEPDRPRESVEHHHAHDHPHEHKHDHSHDNEHPETTVPETTVPQVHAPLLGVNLGNPDGAHLSQSKSSRTRASAPHGRHLTEIKRIIAAAAIPETAKQKAIAIFEALGAAEAKIHNMDIDHVHFHEVGAVDALVDIVGAAVGGEALGVDEIVCSPLNVGGGTVECTHGVFPVPAPATVELLKGAPIFSSGIQAELVTPTGAAIAKTLSTRFADFPRMKIDRVGYGAGSRDFKGHANVLRISIGEAVPERATTLRRIALEASAPTTAPSVTVVASSTEGILQGFASREPAPETITVLEANLDDLNPQVFGYVMDQLLAAGALDALGIPVQMKKGRPGALLTVLCRPEDAGKMTGILFSETTTLGVRQRNEQRQVLDRRWETVSTPWADVRMKIASLNGTVTNYAPEYEDCRKIAETHRVPLKSVMLEAMQSYLLGLAAKKP